MGMWRASPRSASPTSTCSAATPSVCPRPSHAASCGRCAIRARPTTTQASEERSLPRSAVPLLPRGLYKKAIAIGEKALPADHPDLATWYNNLALLYQAQGRLAEAEPFFKKAISTDERRVGDDHRNLATRYNKLTSLYQAQSRLAEAEPF